MCNIMRNASSLLPLFVFNLLLISRIIIAENTTVPLVHSIPLENGTNIPKEYKDLPIVAKCCSMDQIIIRDKEKGAICVSTNSSVQWFTPNFFERYLNSNWTSVKQGTNFVAIVGNPCNYGSFFLDPINDDYFLLYNGSIYFSKYKPPILLAGKDYCMDYVAELGLRTRLCYQEDFDAMMELFNVLGLITSVIFLILTILTYLIIPELRNNYGLTISHYCECLAMSFIILVIQKLGGVSWDSNTCRIISYVNQYFYLASYTWLNVLWIVTYNLIRSYVNYRTILHNRKEKVFLYYSLCAWIIPALLIIGDICFNLNPMKLTTYSEMSWINPDVKTMSFYFFPVSIFLLYNIVVFIFSGITIREFKRDVQIRLFTRNRASDRRDQKMLRTINMTLFGPIVFFFLMALTWALQLICWYMDINSFSWSYLHLLNASHGLFAFLIFVLRKPIRDLVWARMQNLRNIER
ncbi:hypothetical protein M0802_004957 [Mischocyttarus mexicanus]|nr:hypothetical protein M0802_004957 [Mischocyttarus mexicanus]